MSGKLENLVDELDYTRSELKKIEKQKAACEAAIAELKGEERRLMRSIEREAHLYL
jgi:hypothetical protein